MTNNAKTRRLVSGGSQQQEVLFGGGTDTTVPLLPVARPILVTTSGRTEVAVRCPQCRDWHRHTSLGEKHAPCGAHYEVQPKGQLRGAA